MCLVLTVPKEIFIESDRDGGAAQITHEEREDTALGGCVAPLKNIITGLLILQNKIEGT